jgi:hypothetical protein
VPTDQIGVNHPVYDLSEHNRRAPVTHEAGRIVFTLPFEGSIPAAFEGNKIAVKATGGVDVWEEVR